MKLEKIDPHMRLVAEKYSSYKKHLRALVEEWVPLLGLSNWEIVSEFYYEFKPDHPTCFACVTPDWKYQHATVSFFLPRVARADLDLFEYQVVHELVHCLFDPVENDKTDIDKLEFAVVNTAKAFIRVKYSSQNNESKILIDDKQEDRCPNAPLNTGTKKPPTQLSEKAKPSSRM